MQKLEKEWLSTKFAWAKPIYLLNSFHFNLSIKLSGQSAIFILALPYFIASFSKKEHNALRADLSYTPLN